ncbi:MAG: PEP-CTERM sorting domain-containing protein [Vicinamibacteria bacterium]
MNLEKSGSAESVPEPSMTFFLVLGLLAASRLRVPRTGD